MDWRQHRPHAPPSAKSSMSATLSANWCGSIEMPRLRLDDGVIIDLPDDASPTEIAEIVSAYYRPAKPVEGPVASEASLPDPGLDAPTGVPAPPDTASGPPPELAAVDPPGIIAATRRFHIT